MWLGGHVLVLFGDPIPKSRMGTLATTYLLFSRTHTRTRKGAFLSDLKNGPHLSNLYLRDVIVCDPHTQ